MPATIRRGSRSPLVLTWQRQVNLFFFSGNIAPAAWRNTRGESRSWPAGKFVPLKLDGVFGAGTELATEGWQAANGLAPDGVVGPASWNVSLRVDVAGLSPLLYGVDVSAMQDAIRARDWQAMREQGIRFCIARTCVGNEAWIDAQAAASLVACRENGITPGYYCFSYPLPHIAPRVQVDQWVGRIERAGLPLDGVLCALDLEWPPREEIINGIVHYPWRRWNVSASSIAEWNIAALERGRELLGREWLRYSFPYFLSCIEAKRYPELAAGPLWLANYWASGRWPTPEETEAQKVPAPWTEVRIFQHDGNGGLRLPNGVDADFNVLRGGEQALAGLLGPSAPRELPKPVGEDALPAAAEPVLREEMIGTYRRTRLTEEPRA